ncbi:MAG: tRNA (adenosine(37)-N6)-threonylcarbamoyltransferase complex transferase subunit TsaD [bacterium]|nr:tRNA (adenosine(37)-N6)-threonylcarbamoyltransferase complex transferase subunit TsaD [bacterium]
MKQSNGLIILSIETSCDDTAVSVIKAKKCGLFEILSNVVSSQVKLHQKYGGVYPFLAKREHQKNLPIVYRKALLKARQKQNFKKPGLIAVTTGPGLEPCLWAGINFAKEIAAKEKLPILPINHIESHILVNFIDPDTRLTKSGLKRLLPAICLVVSGGHTQLILMNDMGNYKIIGETRDDAAGECFDKAARILGLEYPGGPVIAKQAAKYKTQSAKYKIQLPRPMLHAKNYDFSFSGLKTAVLYEFRSRSARDSKTKEYIIEMSREIQQAIIDVLIKKTIKAAKDYKAKSVLLGGGVTANKELRKQMEKIIKKEMPGVKYLVPNAEYSTDNAVMTGITAYFNWLNPKNKKKEWKKIEANANLRIDRGSKSPSLS